jgi:hypothetical protein
VRQDAVEVAIEPVLAGGGKIHLQQFVHGAAQEQLAVNPQFTI